MDSAIRPRWVYLLEKSSIYSFQNEPTVYVRGEGGSVMYNALYILYMERAKLPRYYRTTPGIPMFFLLPGMVAYFQSDSIFGQCLLAPERALGTRSRNS